MQLTLRSQLIAGTAALVGVSAIALVPVAQQNAGLPALRTAPVSLASFANPVTELIETVLIGDANNFSITDNLFYGEDAYYGEYFYSGVLEYPNGDPYDSYVGLIPEFSYNPLPALRNLITNLSTNIGSLAYESGLSLATLSDAVWNLPAALVTATGQLLTGQVTQALTTIYNATVAPIVDAGTGLVDAGLHITSNVITNITNLISAIPTLAGQWISSTIGAGAALLGTTVGVVSNTITALASLNIEGAWNSVVQGTVGPGDGSILGALVNLTIGPGYGYVEDLGVGVPSLRFLTQSTLGTIANALDTPAGFALPAPVLTTPLAGAAVESAAATRAAVTPAAAAAEEVPATAETAREDSAAGADDSAGVPATTVTAGERTGKAHRGSDAQKNAAGAADQSGKAGAAGKAHASR